VFRFNDISHNENIELGHLCFEVEVAIEKLRSYKWTSIDQIAAQFDSSRRGVSAFYNS